ncbi:Putative peroxiredoxin bcp [bacterium HR37]|nr:Putative peroxiredoxin bcp [bacterium HR37]
MKTALLSLLVVMFVSSFFLCTKTLAELKPGDPAPSFVTTDHDGKKVDLNELKGKWVVLYFYPKDDTPGCTIEAKEFTELYEEFLENNTLVYGISADTKESHCSFRDKYRLKVPLIPDEKHRLMSLYGVEVKNGVASRDTVIIDTSGNIARIYRHVKPAGHAREVLEFIKENSM